MKKIIVLFIPIILLLQGCHLSTSGTWVNDHIDQRERSEIKKLNDKLFKAIVNNDVAAIKTLMSDKLIEKGGKGLDTLIGQVSPLLQTDSYKIIDEYNIHNSTDNVTSTLPSSQGGENAFVINFLSLNKEMYASLLLPNGGDNDLLIMAIYGKYGNKWLLNILRFGQYGYFGKNAIDYYKLAKTNYEKLHLIDAIDDIYLSKQCLKPCNEYFHYKKEEEIATFYDKVIQDANIKYKLPLTLENVAGKPQIFNIRPEVFKDGCFPMVCYVSSIDMKDTVALKMENEKIKKEVNQIFTGINQDKKYVFYQAFNEMPDGKKILNHYGFMDQLSK